MDGLPSTNGDYVVGIGPQIVLKKLFTIAKICVFFLKKAVYDKVLLNE